MKKIHVVLICFFLLVGVLSLRTFWTLSHAFTPDFSVYYQAAKNIMSASSVYTGRQSFTSFAYPLVSGLFFVPFIFLSYQIAQTLFLFINFLALLGISWIVPMIVVKKHSLFLSALLFSLSYLSFPTKFTLGMGQVNLVAYFFLLLSFLLQGLSLHVRDKVRPQRNKIVAAALFLALSCLLKPILGFMLLFFVFQKQWRVLMWVFFFFFIAFVVSIAIDHHATQDYFYYFFHMIPEVSKPVGKQIYYNQGFMSFVFREIGSQQWRLILSYIGMVGIVGVLLARLIKTKDVLYRFACILTALPLLDTLSWQHHFIFLIFPFFYVVHAYIKQKRWYELAVTLLAYGLVSWNFAHPEKLTHFPANLLLSNTFYGALLLFLLLLFSSTWKESIRPPSR